MGVVYPFLENDEVTYMRRAGEKLKSSRGASLMMALLLFLVCAVLGSVVLVAGTASAGRFANLSKMEQRYFAVNSAAELLRTELCGGDPLVITREKTVTKHTPITVAEDGTVSYGQAEEDDPRYSCELPTISGGDKAAQLRYLFARYLVFGTETVSFPDDLTEEQYNHDPKAANDEIPDFTIEVDGKEELAVDIEVRIKENGQLELNLENHQGSEKYRLRMTFATVVDPVVFTGETREIVAAGSGLEEKTDLTEKKVSTVSWNLGSVTVPEESETQGGDGT